MIIHRKFILFTTIIVCCILRLSWETPVKPTSRVLSSEELSNLNRKLQKKFETIKHYTKWTEEEKQRFIEKMKDRVTISGIDENFTSLYDYLDPNEKAIYAGMKEVSSKEIPEFSFYVVLKYTEEIFKNESKFEEYSFKNILTSLTVFIIENPEYWWIYDCKDFVVIDSTYDENHDVEVALLINLSLKSNVNINDLVGNYTSTEIRDMNLEVVRMKKNIVSRIKSLGFKTKYGIIKYIHDYLSFRNVYNDDENLDFIRTLYGALVDNNIVCVAYADAIQLLANEFGIDCVIAASVTHEWNFVKMDDGKWYIIDLTWDDTGYMDRAFNSVTYNVTDFFLTGEDELFYDDVTYKEDEDHLLSFDWYDDTGENDYLTYPPVSSKRYVPSEEELEDAKKIKESTFLFGNIIKKYFLK